MDTVTEDLHRFSLRQSLLIGQIFGELHIIKNSPLDDMPALIDQLHKMVTTRVEDLFYKDKK